MESPAKNPLELAEDFIRCDKVTLKFDNENHTLTSLEVGWLIKALMSQKPTSNDVEKWDIPQPTAWRCRTTDEPKWQYDESKLLTKDLFRREPGFEEEALFHIRSLDP